MTMTELILKMIFWLLAAMVLGGIVAWLLAKVYYKRRAREQVDEHAAVILERNNLIEKLEQTLDKDKLGYEKLSNELEAGKVILLRKETQIKSLQSKLNSFHSSMGQTDSLKRQNNLLNIELERVKEINEKVSNELSEFETVLVRAEDKLEESEKSYRQIIKSLDKEVEELTLLGQQQKQKLMENEKQIQTLEEDLKLYHASNGDPEFIITKDQFLKIEEQLKNYQEEISQLEKEKSALASKISKNTKIDLTDTELLEEESSDESAAKSKNDSSMVRVFRDTYKKITKS
jgi:DNA repair exonuclease SbcCD ATPase subunit